MPDITMCSGIDCPLKENCYRYTAQPSKYRQSFFSEVPYNIEEKRCEYFMNNYLKELTDKTENKCQLKQ